MFVCLLLVTSHFVLFVCFLKFLFANNSICFSHTCHVLWSHRSVNFIAWSSWMLQYFFHFSFFIECYLYVNQDTSNNDNTTARLKSPCYTSFDGSNPQLQFEYHKQFGDTNGWFMYIHTSSECDSNDSNLTFVYSVGQSIWSWSTLNNPIELTGVGERFYVSKIIDLLDDSKIV